MKRILKYLKCIWKYSNVSGKIGINLKVFKYLWKYLNVSEGIQRWIKATKRIWKYSPKLSRSQLKLKHILINISESDKCFKGILKYSNVSKSVQLCPEISIMQEYIQIHSKVFKYVWKYSSVFLNIQMYAKVFKYI